MVGSRVLQYVLLDGRGEPQLIDGRQRIHYGQVGSHITDYTLGDCSGSENQRQIFSRGGAAGAAKNSNSTKQRCAVAPPREKSFQG
jgi:hypothetical protein